jgi:hypothetical protein
VPISAPGAACTCPASPALAAGLRCGRAGIGGSSPRPPPLLLAGCGRMSHSLEYHCRSRACVRVAGSPKLRFLLEFCRIQQSQQNSVTKSENDSPLRSRDSPKPYSHFYRFKALIPKIVCLSSCFWISELRCAALWSDLCRCVYNVTATWVSTKSSCHSFFSYDWIWPTPHPHPASSPH